MPKIRMVCVYQVIMHYRLPLYARLVKDPILEVCVLYGEGDSNSKNKNVQATLPNDKFERQFTIRIPFRTGNNVGTIPVWPFLIFKLIAKNPSVVLCEGFSSPVNTLVAFMYAKVFGKKFIWWSLGKLPGREYGRVRRIFAQLQTYMECNSDAIFTYSTWGKKYFLSLGIPENKIFVGVNVLDTNKKLLEIEKYAEKDGLWGDASYFNIAFIGSITREKNLELLIDLIKEDLCNKAVSCKLHIIGDGSHLNHIKQYAHSRGISERVRFYGRMNEGASTILANCDVMVLPGRGGLAICEGMLNKLPIITGAADGTEHDLVTKSNGFYVEHMNVNNLRDKIEYLYNNPSIKQAMGEESFRLITETFHYDKYYHTILEAIKYCETGGAH